MSPEFQKIATPQMQQMIAKELAPRGAPTAVIYTGKGDRPDATRYTYRALRTRGKITFIIILDKKTKLLDGMGIRPE
jgi:hypothetical protein